MEIFWKKSPLPSAHNLTNFSKTLTSFSFYPRSYLFSPGAKTYLKANQWIQRIFINFREKMDIFANFYISFIHFVEKIKTFWWSFNKLKVFGCRRAANINKHQTRLVRAFTRCLFEQLNLIILVGKVHQSFHVFPPLTIIPERKGEILRTGDQWFQIVNKIFQQGAGIKSHSVYILNPITSLLHHKIISKNIFCVTLEFGCHLNILHNQMSEICDIWWFVGKKRYIWNS